MPRQRQEGNRYFSLDVDFFSDKKIKILKARYGADGITIFIYLLCEIYKNVYYLQVDDDFEFVLSDDLNMESNKVKQVMKFLLERSLLDSKLFQSDTILTSAGIQRRFQRMVKSRAIKNPITVGRYWLLSEEETETFIKVNLSLNNSENNDDNSKKNNDDFRNNETKEKEKKIKDIYTAPQESYFEDRLLNDAFLLFIQSRQSHGEKLSYEQILCYRDELKEMSTKTEELIAIAKKAFMNGWKNFYPLKKKESNTSGKKNEVKNRFNNFQQRNYDFDEYEKKLLNQGGGTDDTSD